MKKNLFLRLKHMFRMCGKFDMISQVTHCTCTMVPILDGNSEIRAHRWINSLFFGLFKTFG